MVHKMFRKQQNPTMCKGVIKQSVSLSSLKALITECFFAMQFGSLSLLYTLC